MAIAEGRGMEGSWGAMAIAGVEEGCWGWGGLGGGEVELACVSVVSDLRDWSLLASGRM